MPPGRDPRHTFGVPRTEQRPAAEPVPVALPAVEVEDRYGPWKQIAAVVVIVQIIQIALLWNDLSVTGPIIDSYDFHSEASRIALGRVPLHQPYFQSPLLPWLLSIVYRILGTSPRNSLFLQAILTVVIAWEVYALARRVLSPKAAVLAGCSVAFYGPLLFFDAQITSAPLDVVTALGMLVLATRLDARSSLRDHAILGVVAGFAIAARGTIAPFALFVALWPLLLNRPRWKEGLRPTAVIAGGLVLGLLPVAFANWERSGHFVFTTANVGLNLWIGNNPDIAATTALRPGHAWEHLLFEPARNGALGLFEQSVYLRNKALAWMVHNPVEALKNFALKLGDNFNGLEIPRNLDTYGVLGRTSVTAALLWEIPYFRFPFGLVLPLATLGLAARWKDPTRATQTRLTAAMVLLNALGIILFFPCGRYRLAIDIALIVPAVDGALLTWESARHRSLAFRAPILIGVVAVAAWANLAPPFTGPRLAGELRYQRVLTEVAAERWSMADTELKRLIDDNPDNADAWRLLGQVLDNEDDHDAPPTRWSMPSPSRPTMPTRGSISAPFGWANNGTRTRFPRLRRRRRKIPHIRSHGCNWRRRITTSTI